MPLAAKHYLAVTGALILTMLPLLGVSQLKHERKQPAGNAADILVPVSAHTNSRIEHMAQAWIGMQRTSICAFEGQPIDIVCNAQGAPFEEAIDCAKSFTLKGRGSYHSDGNCVDLVYSASRWQVESELIAKYPHAPSLPAALRVQGVVIAGLDERYADQCEVCERDHPDSKDCYRAIVNDPRKRVVWFIPCRGEPRSETR